ncbi:hypothetical protein H634G_10618 [Metarhizium anisopliae BRIP 53293]|uniref:Uncharacterized protein n=1 Tax=Metarhizium anisopliae BRIP 53293 TaxID=1291518 RepID=A0A0D9NJF8_METAN|nr:hypothetical protein H634G_10618 [Metarhizium anisopliae BRIP 53293]KJK92607.1 hypothetical protein H633G_03525 [Metarhizium anisopliae BRIP 53284]
MPLSLAYFDQELAYGMVVIDITDQTKKMELEEDRQRVALSGSDYITKFGYEKAENMERFYVTCPGLKLLEKVLVVDACVFNVDAALRRAEVDVSQFSSIRNFDHFQEAPRSILLEMLRYSTAPGMLGHLLGLAFDGCEHLDMVDFKSLSAEAADAALETKELSGVKKISLSAEMLNTTGTSIDTPTNLADTLAQCSIIENIYVMCEPELGRDRRLAKQRQSIDFLVKLVSKMEEIPSSVFLSAMYRAAICKTLWLPEHYQPSYNRFPNRNVFYRTQLNFTTRQHIALGILPFLVAADTILARGWTVLVSKRTFTNYLVAEDNMCGTRENLPEDCQWMEYAFVRSGSNVHYGKPQVVGVREFLEIMAPEVDLDLAERELCKRRPV